MPSKSAHLRPRRCELARGENGYGFHLHGEKGRAGQFIRLVEPDSPSEASGLRAGDRLVLVNGDNVEHESHQQVVSRIRGAAAAGAGGAGGAAAALLVLVVVDAETDRLLKDRGLRCLAEYVEDGLPLLDGSDREELEQEQEQEEYEEDDEEEEEEEEDGEHRNGKPLADSPVPESNGDSDVDLHVRAQRKLSSSTSEVLEEVLSEPRPRLCVILRGPGGYGFNLHSERARPGQYVRAVDRDSPAERAGLQPHDRVVQVNGVPVGGRSHSEVVEAIKAGAGQTQLLVVDPDTDLHFRSCRVAPTAAHLTGPLPEPVLNGAGEELGAVFPPENGRRPGERERERERDSKMSVSPSPSNTSSNASFTPPPAHTPPEGPGLLSVPELSLSLQQVKERAHQQRCNRRAPPMDWTRKNQLFSNL